MEPVTEKPGLDTTVVIGCIGVGVVASLAVGTALWLTERITNDAPATWPGWFAYVGVGNLIVLALTAIAAMEHRNRA